MTITVNGKNWIAQKLGIDNCFVSSGISWTYYAIDGNTLDETGGTAQLVARLALSTTDKIVLTSSPYGTYRYNDLKSGNGGQDVTLTDSIGIRSEDGDPSSESQYCYDAGTPPPPSTGITANGKNWIAQKLGIDNCFVPSGISWTYYAIDGNTLDETGGTAQLVARLALSTTDKVVLTSPPYGTYRYNDLKAGNDGYDVTLIDSISIKAEDGDPSSESQFCYDAGTPPPPTVPIKIFKEAENYIEIKQPMVVKENANASNGKYIINLFNDPITGTEQPCAGYARYRINIPSSSTYKIIGRMKAGYVQDRPFTWHDSFYAQIDNKAIIDWHGDSSGTWNWSNIFDSIYLEAGIHELTIYCREAEACFDVMLITDDLEYVPTSNDIAPPGSIPDDAEDIGPYEFLPPPEGLPTIYLFLGDLEMSQDGIDWHFKMDHVNVTNTSTHPIYIAFRVKLFKGNIGACPTYGEVFDGLDRTATAKTKRIIQLDPDEVAEQDLDFYQPLTIQGIHTVCLYVHGAWTSDDLEYEIKHIGG
uniref:Uncharacterized protein n=1 Tax=viral metagenome TaxID=1070528 RepID=A0A6M3M570_9ZZZZ